MNNKKFIKIKIQKSLKKLLNKQHASGQELRRLNLLSERVASLLHDGESKVNKISENMNAGRRKLVDLRQWRAFSISYDMGSRKSETCPLLNHGSKYNQYSG